jgi:chromosome segregation ATPase
MSSIEDLYMASSSVSPSQHSPLLTRKTQPTIQELQNELDQLHDKLDELTRENQTLKNRTQEFDTIYEENEYLYAEKSHWNEEIERSRIRELVLEQEVQTLKEREKEFLLTNDTNINNNSNTTQLKLKIDWLHRTNNQLELEIVRLREQIDLLNKKCQETKKELINKDEHYKQLLNAVDNKQQLPQVDFILIKIIKKNILFLGINSIRKNQNRFRKSNGKRKTIA